MKKAIAFALLAVALACSDGPSSPSSPSPNPSPTPPPTPGSRVTLSGRVYAASDAPEHYPAGNSLSARVFIAEGVNAGREVSSANGGYRLTDLEPGTMTLHFSTSGYRDELRTVDVRTDTTLDVGLEPGPWPGFVVSGNITTEWGELIPDVGVEAVRDGRVFGGGSRPPIGSGVSYWISTLPAGDYVLRVRKGGYDDPQPRVTVDRDIRLDIVLKRVKVLLFGTVREAAPCAGAIQDVRVEIVSGPDAGLAATTTASGYRTQKVLNWGQFRVRASKAGYVPVEVAMNVPFPGASCEVGNPEYPGCTYIYAPSEIERNFVLQRTNSCS